MDRGGKFIAVERSLLDVEPEPVIEIAVPPSRFPLVDRLNPESLALLARFTQTLPETK